MEIEKELPKRKPLRLRDFDYSIPGAYFITICTHNKTAMLSHVVGAIHESPVIELTPYGEITDEIISNIPARFAVVVDQYVIMPNHIHFILAITDDSQMRATRESPLRSRSVISKIVGYLKMNVSKEIHQQNEKCPVWQRGFHDHIIRDRRDYEEHVKYICENPAKWHFDPLYV
jgi:REP element-mobilizing transposase RayT